MIYLFLAILLCCLSYHFDYRNKKGYRKSSYVACWLIFVLIAGLRYRLGIDTIAYESSYNEFPDLTGYWDFDFDSTRFGRGFLLFSAICKSIIDDFVFFQIIHAVFVNTIVFYFFYKYTRHIFFALIMYLILGFFPYNFEVMRESCAVAMLLIGWQYFLANKWFKYYLCALIGVFFHPSALIMAVLPIFYLYPFRFFFRINKVLILTLGIIFIIGTLVTSHFFDIISLINLSAVENYADLYQNSNYGESLNLNIVGLAIFAIKSIIYPVAFVVILKHSLSMKNAVRTQDDEVLNQYMKLEFMFSWYIYISLLTLFLFIFYRFNNYFFPFAIIVMSDAMFTVFKTRKIDVRLKFNLWALFITPFLFLNVYTNFFHEDGESGVNLIRRYYPYKSVIFKEKDKEREKLYRFYDR